MEQNVGQLERRFSMLRRIKGVPLRDKVKSVDIRKELGVSSIQENVKRNENTLVWTHAENGRKRSESSW